MSTLQLVRGGWYRRGDGYIVGPLLPIVRGDANDGAVWCVRRPYTPYDANGVDMRGHKRLNLTEKVEKPADPEAVSPPRRKIKRKRASPTPRPADRESCRVIIGKSVIKITVDDNHVSLTGWDQPIPRSAIAGLVELLLEIAK